MENIVAASNKFPGVMVNKEGEIGYILEGKVVPVSKQIRYYETSHTFKPKVKVVLNGDPATKKTLDASLLVWEAFHSDKPKGHKVSFMNGDPSDCSLDNLFLIPSKEFPMLDVSALKKVVDVNKYKDHFEVKGRFPGLFTKEEPVKEDFNTSQDILQVVLPAEYNLLEIGNLTPNFIKLQKVLIQNGKEVRILNSSRPIEEIKDIIHNSLLKNQKVLLVPKEKVSNFI